MPDASAEAMRNGNCARSVQDNLAPRGPSTLATPKANVVGLQTGFRSSGLQVLALLVRQRADISVEAWPIGVGLRGA